VTTGGSRDPLDAGNSVASLEEAHLQFADLLQVLLKRVETLVDADTAVILLLDRDGSHLVAHSALGLEDEVHQGVRVPVGAGFAGRIAATRSPMTLDEVGPDNAVNPILWKEGVRSMLGAPLIIDGRLLGVIHVGTREPRQFSASDIESLEREASRVARVVSDHQSLAERLTARTLQDSLLPGRLPEIEGLQFAARFVAAEDVGVGGDWFDVFRLPDGHVGIVIGDVAGVGLRAAIVMGRLRSVLRAYAVALHHPAAPRTRTPSVRRRDARTTCRWLSSPPFAQPRGAFCPSSSSVAPRWGCVSASSVHVLCTRRLDARPRRNEVPRC
jgi:phosphoserine phosphatase RsbU/P